MKCKCCKKADLELFSKKFCTPCSIYTRDIRRKITYYKKKSKDLCIRLYGVENGVERIRK